MQRKTVNDLILNTTAINSLGLYGKQCKTNYYIDPEKFLDWVYDNFKFVQYNPRKKVDREGLSITSLDGGLGGIPDLDSLREYNQQHGTNYDEKDFKTRTPVAEYPELKHILDIFGDSLFRCHILKINPGGFFPPHRDHNTPFIDSFRLIMPLQYVNPPFFNFVIDEDITHWDTGFLYFADTTKAHYLFNCGDLPSYWIVFNVETSIENVQKVLGNLSVKV
tara:strand:+ start:555 stop:1217 length:663 start_codon:yes stop_codon:yes gene_type:complete